MKKPIVPKIIDILKEDLIWCQYDLNEYQVIFGENRKQKELLLKETGQYFSRLHLFYWDRFTISISKFTDKCEQGSNKNLSIYILLELIDKFNINRVLVESCIKEIEKAASTFRKRRSKYIAHRDLKSAILENDIKEDKLHLSNVKIVYENVGKILNEFYEKIEDSSWDWNLASLSGAESLMFLMKEGIVYQEFKEKRKDWILDQKEFQESSMKELEINQ